MIEKDTPVDETAAAQSYEPPTVEDIADDSHPVETAAGALLQDTSF